MNLDDAYVVYFGTGDPNFWKPSTRPEDIKDFLASHKSLVLLTDDIYRTWNQNTHHFTTNFSHKTLLPSVLHLLGESMPYDKIEWKEEFVDGFNISRYVPKAGIGQFNIWSLTYEIGLNGDSSILQYSPELEEYKLPSLYDMGTPYHKLYTFPHTCSKITNFGKNNGKKICVSCDSQMIPIIPIFATIYQEVWMLDQRRQNVSVKKELDRVDFDDILICFGYTGAPDLLMKKFTEINFR